MTKTIEFTTESISKKLEEAIHKTMDRLDADYCIINWTKNNRYANVALFEGNDCIDWNYEVFAEED